MRDFVRLHLVAKVTYYLGWIALVCGGLVHFSCWAAVRCDEPNKAESV